MDYYLINTYYWLWFQVIFEKEEVAEMKNFGDPGKDHRRGLHIFTSTFYRSKHIKIKILNLIVLKIQVCPEVSKSLQVETYVQWYIVGLKLVMSNYSHLILAGLLLMGFKPRSSVKNYFHIRPAQFLYPSEKVFITLLMK